MKYDENVFTHKKYWRAGLSLTMGFLSLSCNNEGRLKNYYPW